MGASGRGGLGRRVEARAGLTTRSVGEATGLSRFGRGPVPSRARVAGVEEPPRRRPPGRSFRGRAGRGRTSVCGERSLGSGVGRGPCFGAGWVGSWLAPRAGRRGERLEPAPPESLVGPGPRRRGGVRTGGGGRPSAAGS